MLKYVRHILAESKTKHKTMMRSIFTAALIFTISLVVQAQPKNMDAANYFDFWVGEWDLTWKYPDGSTGKGKNTISWVLDDNVILESFEGHTGPYEGYIGKSWSVYTAQTDTWNQTWVDNQGGYLDFTGEFDGEKRIFSRQVTGSSGQTLIQRMVFHDVQEDSITWIWESSSDEGETWTENWRIQYVRIKNQETGD